MLDRSLSNFTDLRSDNMLHFKCRKILDRAQPTGLTFQPCGNSCIGFSSLNDDGGHKATVKRESFFVSAFGLHSWWLDGGCFGTLVSIVTSLLTCIQPPFLFSSEKGEQLRHGGSL